MSALMVNYAAVLVTGVLIFLLGGLWYSRYLFAKQWVELSGVTEEQMKKGGTPLLMVAALATNLLMAWSLAVVLHLTGVSSWYMGVFVALVAWTGFTGATSYLNNLFSGRKPQLWVLDSGYSLLSFLLAGVVLTLWK